MNYQELYNKNGYLYKFKAFESIEAQKLIHEFNKNYKYHLTPSLLIKEELFLKYIFFINHLTKLLGIEKYLI